MGREYRRHEKKPAAFKGSRRKHEPNAYNSKIAKPPSKQQLQTELRHAVSHGDYEAFEEYDDWGED
jgi:hypothetical protein